MYDFYPVNNLSLLIIIIPNKISIRVSQNMFLCRKENNRNGNKIETRTFDFNFYGRV